MTKRLVVLLAATMALTGCGPTGMGWARIVGFIINGQTGARMNFFKDTKLKNVTDNVKSDSVVYGVVRGELKRAIPCGQGDALVENKMSAEGCYKIENLPLGASIPLFAQAPGFDDFHAIYFTQNRNDSSVDDYQETAHIRMFPEGFNVDYRIFVHIAQRGIAGMTVTCQATTTANSFQTVGGGFLTPNVATAGAVSAESGADGVAVIPGSALVNGAEYHCEVFRQDASESKVLSGQVNITAGVSAADQALALSIGGSDDLVALRSNVDNSTTTHGANGKMEIVFNRPAEFVPATADCQQASITQFDRDNDLAPAGAMVANVTGNGASEQVTATLSADGLTLTLGFNLQTAFDPDDAATINFSGIALRAKGSDPLKVWRIGSAAGCTAIGGGSGYTVAALASLRTTTQSNSLVLF